MLYGPRLCKRLLVDSKKRRSSSWLAVPDSPLLGFCLVAVLSPFLNDLFLAHFILEGVLRAAA